MVKISSESAALAKHISGFIDYAGEMLTSSENTLKNYRLSLESYLDFLEQKQHVKPENLKASDFEAEKIRTWIKSLKEKGNCGATCNVRLSCMRIFLKYLKQQDLKYLYLYTQVLEIRPQKKIKPEVKGLSKEAIQVLLKMPDQKTNIGRRDLVFMIVMYNTACRLDELRSLQLKHIHLEGPNPCIRVVGKGSKVRTIPLLPRSVAHLRKYIDITFKEHYDSEAYLFYSRVKGMHSRMSETAIEKMITKYAVKAHNICPEIPLNLHPHQIRHSKATHWLEDGMNIIQISRLLGHANLETTMVYLEVSTEMKRQAMATLDEESSSKVERKWKNSDGSLKEFCFGR